MAGRDEECDEETGFLKKPGFLGPPPDMKLRDCRQTFARGQGQNQPLGWGTTRGEALAAGRKGEDRSTCAR